MKKNTLMIACFMMLALSSCYEDKSTLPENSIDGVELNITESEKVILVGYKEQLDIVPNITRNGKVDDTGLTFEWAINLFPGWSKTEYEVIGREKELHTVLENEVSEDSYYLRLLVTDTQNDNLQYSFLYQVNVQPSMLDGLLIADTKDGQTTNLNLVMNDKLTIWYDKEEKVFRNILSETYPGLIKSLTPASAGYYSGDNYMWLIDENGKLGAYETQDFVFSGMDQMFVLPTERVDLVRRAGQFICASTDLGFFAVNYITFQSSYFGWPTAGLDAYPIDNNICTSISALNGVNNSTCAMLAWYCDEADAFISGDFSFMGATAVEFNNPEKFDLSNKSAVCGGNSVDEVTPTFLLKDEVTGEYIIYILARQEDYDADWNWVGKPSSVKAAYTVPAEGKALLDKAIATSFACLESILYVATEEGIYTINFAGATPTVNTTAQFTANGEKITGMQLYQQGQYITAYDNATNSEFPVSGSWEKKEWNNRAVVVTTQKGEEGVVYVVPMKNLGTGNLDASAALRYDGFGRILAVSATCY